VLIIILGVREITIMIKIMIRITIPVIKVQEVKSWGRKKRVRVFACGYG